jgi:uncharacterized protein (TIGR01777 family)
MTFAAQPRLKIVLAGGSGQIGQGLVPMLVDAGHEVVIVSRNPAAGVVRTVAWDAKTVGDWAQEVEGADVLVNLAGRSVNCRYTRANRLEIMDSRVDATVALGNAITQTSRPPRVWLQASTATIYAHRHDAANDEHTGILGGGERDVPETWRFSTNVARAWEAAAQQFDVPRTRLVLLRSAMVMSPRRGGIFDVLLGLVRRGLGGRVAGGRQYVSWIHHEDFARALLWLVERDDLRGAVNIAAPGPMPQADFMAALRAAWGAHVGLPATRWMAEIGAFVMRTETELVFKSRRVVPTRLLESQFTFRHPAWPQAADDLCRAWRQARQAQTPC